jgi:hypothetical protein
LYRWAKLEQHLTPTVAEVMLRPVVLHPPCPAVLRLDGALPPLGTAERRCLWCIFGWERLDK